MGLYFRLKEFRKERGLTQADLADILSMTQSAVSKMERGAYNVTLSTINKVATKVNANPLCLIEEEDGYGRTM